jgi:hypothetical protein
VGRQPSQNVLEGGRADGRADGQTDRQVGVRAGPHPTFLESSLSPPFSPFSPLLSHPLRISSISVQHLTAAWRRCLPDRGHGRPAHARPVGPGLDSRRRRRSTARNVRRARGAPRRARSASTRWCPSSARAAPSSIAAHSHHNRLIFKLTTFPLPLPLSSLRLPHPSPPSRILGRQKLFRVCGGRGLALRLRGSACRSAPAPCHSVTRRFHKSGKRNHARSPPPPRAIAQRLRNISRSFQRFRLPSGTLIRTPSLSTISLYAPVRAQRAERRQAWTCWTLRRCAGPRLSPRMGCGLTLSLTLPWRGPGAGSSCLQDRRSPWVSSQS